MKPAGKYKAFFPGFKLENRQWPDQETTHAPIWGSVCLRDGNQALEKPMTRKQKMEFFGLLVEIGFKEIEIGFPSANDTEFGFVRHLIENHLIPDDVTIQVLVQAREDLIQRTVESLIGVRRVIIHMYNSTSPAQRRIVFNKTKEEIKAMAVQGTEWVKKYSAKLTASGTEVVYQYSPESFSATETDYALEVCEAVMDVWGATPDRKIILNLPETVQVAPTKVYADQIEWFCKHMSRRDCAIISIHTHNDRGTGVASAEFGMLAGADRVEGTLFGNGERTGNCDLVTVALNMYTQEIDPQLDFSNLPHIVEVYERCTGMKVSPRHPYAGELVFTAFSGSHQDAIRKAFLAIAQLIKHGVAFLWDVPYLHIDPADIGRTYEKLIRVNGQSGKAGIAHLLEEYNIHMPKGMECEFGSVAGKKIDALGREVAAEDIWTMFATEYLDQVGPYKYVSFRPTNYAQNKCHCVSVIMSSHQRLDLNGDGNGPISAFIHALLGADINVELLSQAQHSLGKGANAKAIAYVQLRFPDGQVCWGAGINPNIEFASIRAIISALNRK